MDPTSEKRCSLSASTRTPAADEVLARRLFPFCFAIDAERRITIVGDRWQLVAPELALGAAFDEVIEIERPNNVTSFEEILKSDASIFILTLRSRPLFKLRGQFLALNNAAGAAQALFVGGPWITRVAELTELGIELQDFPPHDPRGDLLFVLQTQESNMADLRALTGRLREQMKRQAQLESQLLQIQRMELVGRFAGGMAHNFNNILMAIHGYAALALSRVPAGDPVRSWVEQIRSATDHAASLTRALLAMSRQHPLKLEPLDLRRELADIERLLRPLLGERIELLCEVDGSIGPSQADRAALKQIVMNLVLNARDAMPHGGSVRIRVEPASRAPTPDVKREDFLELRVADTGIGMDESTQTRIFDPFFTTKEVGKGVGLGLSSVAGLVEQCRGHISVESALGRGTTFRVFLPLVEGSASDVAPVALAPVGGRGERLLLVEDEPLVRKLFEQLLTRAGYQVSSSLSSDSALELVKGSRPFNIIVTDVVMPGLSGPQLAARIEEACGITPTIFMSGYTEDPAMRASALKPHQRFMSKPFAPEELLTAIRALLAKSPLREHPEG
jgi:signal transduction histidine kinase/ActR/RegA family two-component response regulator